jgi:DNA processing protein
MNIINKVSPQSHKWLQRTTVIAKPPKCLWYIGKLPADAPTVAIVGSRKPTPYGRAVTLQLAAALAERGVIIVSGLALGHDALASQGALDGGGITVGVVGNGLNNMYPKTTWQLRQRVIEQGGAVISEYPPETGVTKWNFLERNRLISALSDVVVVVEAGARSGTLNTAMHALEQGKELMAVPGNITSPLSIGCNQLLARGAAPVTSVDDIFERLGLGLNLTIDSATPARGDDDTQNLILKLIRGGTIDGDAIMAARKLDASTFNQAITMLELNGIVRGLGANRWVLRGKS